MPRELRLSAGEIKYRPASSYSHCPTALLRQSSPHGLLKKHAWKSNVWLEGSIHEPFPYKPFVNVLHHLISENLSISSGELRYPCFMQRNKRKVRNTAAPWRTVVLVPEVAGRSEAHSRWKASRGNLDATPPFVRSKGRCSLNRPPNDRAVWHRWRATKNAAVRATP